MVLLRLTVTVCPIGGCRTFLFSFFFFNSVSYKFFVLPLFTFFMIHLLSFTCRNHFTNSLYFTALGKRNWSRYEVLL